MKYLIILAALFFGWNYLTTHYEFHDALVYAKKHPQSQLAPAIDYYSGLAYYQRSDYPKAQEAFTQLLEQFPTAQQYVPDALIKLDDSAEYNHDWDTAKTALTKYLDDYPNGKQADLARKRLDMVKYNHP